MSDEPKPSGRYSGPEEPAVTRPVDKTGIIEGLLRAMQREVQDGFAASRAEVSKVAADVHMLIEDRRIVHDRIGMLEERMRRQSGTVKAVTAADEEQAKAFAAETQKRQALEAELLATRQRLDELAKEQEQTRAVVSETKTIATDTKTVAEDAKTLAEDTKTLTVAQTAELERQTATLDRLAKIAANPVVKDFARAVATAFATWLALKGLK